MGPSFIASTSAFVLSAVTGIPFNCTSNALCVKQWKLRISKVPRTEKVKKARVENLVEMIRSYAGLESGVFEHLKMEREDSGDKEVASEAFKLCCLNLMKTLNMSDSEYDDLCWWVEEVTRRGLSLSSMPTSRALKLKVNKEMVPPNMQSSETGTRFNLKDTLFHHGERLVERPDTKEHLRAVDTLVHFAKIGSVFQTGLCKSAR